MEDLINGQVIGTEGPENKKKNDKKVKGSGISNCNITDETG